MNSIKLSLYYKVSLKRIDFNGVTILIIINIVTPLKSLISVTMPRMLFLHIQSFSFSKKIVKRILISILKLLCEKKSQNISNIF